jgi:hypothetical protein
MMSYEEKFHIKIIELDKIYVVIVIFIFIWNHLET